MTWSVLPGHTRARTPSAMVSTPNVPMASDECRANAPRSPPGVCADSVMIPPSEDTASGDGAYAAGAGPGLRAIAPEARGRAAAAPVLASPRPTGRDLLPV